VQGFQGSGKSAITRTANATSNQEILAENRARTGFSVWNDDSTANVKVACDDGAAASATNFTTVIPPNTGWECPFEYRGSVTAIADSATGAVNVTEYT
jgi:hypothetical protein